MGLTEGFKDMVDGGKGGGQRTRELFGNLIDRRPAQRAGCVTLAEAVVSG
jgi:hypothetical protein